MAGLLVLISPVVLALFTIWMETLESKVLTRPAEVAEPSDAVLAEEFADEVSDEEPDVAEPVAKPENGRDMH